VFFAILLISPDLNFESQVNGVPKSFSQVTEEDHDLMTPDEYTTFFEIMQARP